METTIQGLGFRPPLSCPAVVVVIVGTEATSGTMPLGVE